jgi:hypothetical protein
MKAQDAHEDILSVSAPSHCFDEVNARMLCTLAAGVVRVAPHDDLTDLVRDAMGFIKVSAFLLATFIRKVALQQFQEIHSALMEGSKAFRPLRPDATLTTQHVPLHKHDQHLHHIVTRVGDVIQAVKL